MSHDFMEHYNWERALEAIKKAEARLEEMEADTALLAVEAVKTYAKEARATLEKQVDRYTDAVVMKAFGDAARECESAISFCNDALSHFNLEKALTHFHEAKSKRAAVLDEYHFAKAVAWGGTTADSLLDLDKKLSAERERVQMIDLKATLTQALNAAQHNFDHRIDDRMLEALNATRDAIDAIRCSGIVNAELEKTTTQVAASMMDIAQKVSFELVWSSRSIATLFDLPWHSTLRAFSKMP